ncbi:MAG: bifunctional metallophosphatase/5'-nucleotidase [Chlorobi bacterium]|nr:bifunctional metallophosphatase/5'-nucleotidase [Chlorobiota bacterium]MCI0716278.1 bifunctional metallophosphatase/5'-nucleotidase [Chlorobiota bacterium]
MKKLFFALLLILNSCWLIAQTTEVVFIQLNDVYEIAPLEGGKYGGLARVSTIIKDYKAKNPNTYVILSGDFISPSALGTSEYEGKRINGRQMVDVLNAIGLDFVTFGNHEFDYKYEVLQERIDESKFEWISSNVFNTVSDPRDVKGGMVNIKFGKNDRNSMQIEKLFTIEGRMAFPEYKILKVPTYIKNQHIKLGLFGLCIDANKQPYVHYENYIDAGKRVYNQIKDSIDYLLGSTHLSIDDDKNLASQLPQLRLIMGGHEHVNMMHKVGETIITKADANARTIYVHTLKFDESNKLIDIKSDLVNIDSTVAEEPKVKELVDEWTTRAFKGFIDKGFDPLVMVYDLKNESLDGREETVRYKLCPLGVLIAMAMLDAAKGSDCAVFNSGAIRIDDVLKGEITQYDIIRVLPFGGRILQVEMKGSLLKQIMETGWNNKGNGGFLQFYGIEQTAAGWKTKGGFIDDNKTHKVSMSDYLLSGMEQNFGYLTRDNPSIIKISEPDPSDRNDLRNDMRFAVINYLKKWNR